MSYSTLLLKIGTALLKVDAAMEPKLQSLFFPIIQFLLVLLFTAVIAVIIYIWRKQNFLNLK